MEPGDGLTAVVMILVVLVVLMTVLPSPWNLIPAGILLIPALFMVLGPAREIWRKRD